MVGKRVLKWMVEQVMDLSPGELQKAGQAVIRNREPADPLRCFTVREVAGRMRVSEDTVRQEMATGVLPFITVGSPCSADPAPGAGTQIVWKRCRAERSGKNTSPITQISLSTVGRFGRSPTWRTST